MGSKALCPYSILPVSTENRTAPFKDLIWVNRMAFGILSDAKECGDSPCLGDRTPNAVEEPHYTKLLLNVVSPWTGPNAHWHP